MPKLAQDFNKKGSGGKISEYLPEQNAQRILQLAAGGTGEANTGSNQGTDGIGVYDAKVGVDLQFRHIAPASPKITVSLNGKDIDLDIAVGTTVDTVCVGNDARLSDARTPTAHILATSGPHTDTLPWTDLNKTGSSLADLATRTHANLSDAPTDAHHAQSHDNTYHSTNYKVDFSENTAFNKDFGTLGTEVCVGNDSRLSDSRTPTQHAMDSATYHTSSDIATLNASTTKHGFLKKLDNVATNFMNGQGNWAEPAGGGGGTAKVELQMKLGIGAVWNIITKGNLELDASGEWFSCDFFVDDSVDATEDIIFTAVFTCNETVSSGDMNKKYVSALKTDNTESFTSWNVSNGVYITTVCGNGVMGKVQITIAAANINTDDIVTVVLELDDASQGTMKYVSASMEYGLT